MPNAKCKTILFIFQWIKMLTWNGGRGSTGCYNSWWCWTGYSLVLVNSNHDPQVTLNVTLMYPTRVLVEVVIKRCTSGECATSCLQKISIVWETSNNDGVFCGSILNCKFCLNDIERVGRQQSTNFCVLSLAKNCITSITINYHPMCVHQME